jgi:hypothetical protein
VPSGSNIANKSSKNITTSNSKSRNHIDNDESENGTPAPVTPEHNDEQEIVDMTETQKAEKEAAIKKISL